MIRQGTLSGSVEAVFLGSEQCKSIQLGQGTRRLCINDRKVPSAEEFCKDLAMVALSPEHLLLVNRSPEERRRYLDQILFSKDSRYLKLAQKFRRALRHKQKLLKQQMPFPAYEDQVAPWNHELVQAGEQIRSLRHSLVKELSVLVAKHYLELALDGKEVTLIYKTPQRAMEEELQSQARREHLSGRALVGPHRDELDILLSQQAVASLASQGERASIVLSLKLAELAILKTQTSKEVYLFLDDLGATLDPERQSRALEIIQGLDHQTLISTTSKKMAKGLELKGGKVLCRRDEQSKAGFSFARWVAVG